MNDTMKPTAARSADAAVTIGVDLGGTGTRVVALAAAGESDGAEILPTYGGDDPGEALAVLTKRIRAVAAGRAITGIGIGASGPVDATGVIQNRATLPAYTGLPLAKRLRQTFGVACVVDNDAVTAAVAEKAYGAHPESAAMLVVTLGTGVGVAFLDHGQPFKTAAGTHPELGHISVSGPQAHCYCGLATCWEQLASRTALTRQLGVDPDGAALAARSGDAAAQESFDLYGRRVGIGLATLVSVFDPSHVIVGGGAARFFDLFEAGARSAMARCEPFTAKGDFGSTTLGPEAGALGAAFLAQRAGGMSDPIMGQTSH
jgi:glucokinase